MNAIVAENLEKRFRVRAPVEGAWQRVQRFFVPQYREVIAVHPLSLEIPAGQRVAFVGPNGAGKSTTLKMLTGILFPTAGTVSVLGRVPWKQRRELAYRIGTVFGQRSQLWYHLPAGATFDLLARIYDLDDRQYRRNRQELTEAFGVARLMDKPVRQLSLGERMRCEVVASLLHDPEILFLDEPTIGLDVTAKSVIRDLVRRRSEERGTTLLLTSHDTGDMERVCERVIVIHAGRLLLDEPVNALRQRFIRRKILTLQTGDAAPELRGPGTTVVEASPHRLVLQVDTAIEPVERVIERALRATQLRDITVEDPPMEDIVKEIYASAPVV